MIRAALALLAPLLSVLTPATARAESSYGCLDLAGQHALASLEGAEGVFYRIDPDLHLFHPFSDETADFLATLSRTLAAKGTTLVYVPVPTRSLAMPEFLPPEARDLGYDPMLASTLYLDLLKRLEDRDVLTVDARQALRAPAGEQPSFLRTDPRLTSVGARRLARELARTIASTSGRESPPEVRFETRANGQTILRSEMRSILQRHCLMPLPEAVMDAFATTRIGFDSSGVEGAIASALGGEARIALVGTPLTGEPTANLAGFLSEYSRIDVRHHTSEDGGSFAAISSYLTSREFQEARPTYLLWLNPIENSLADHGDQPMRELIAAAADNCELALPVGRGVDVNTLIADLGGVSPERPVTLFVDADASLARTVRFDFIGPDGLVRSRSIHRPVGQVTNGRFYLPMTGLWPEGARTVDIVLDAPFGPNGRVAACLG